MWKSNNRVLECRGKSNRFHILSFQLTFLSRDAGHQRLERGSRGDHILFTEHPEKNTLLLDGGLGRELRFRGVELSETIWSAIALLEAPEILQQIHFDYIKAGADIITTNTYGVIRTDLAREGIEHRFAELNLLACKLADQARRQAGSNALIAGSLPPLRGSFRADLVGPFEEIEPLYREQAQILAPHVDLLICETMSSARESRAAAQAACSTGKPVWVSWTLDEDHSGRLRSGETVKEAVKALEDLPISGLLANCCAPESISSFLSQTKVSEVKYRGGYANTFNPIPKNWTLGGEQETDGLLPLRQDLSPESYVTHVARWLELGANVIGGCCGTRPAHTAKMRSYIDKHSCEE